jgi:hypothetical protein
MLRRLERVAEQVGSLEEDLKELTDGEVRALTPEFKERYAGGESLDDLLAKAYAAMRGGPALSSACATSTYGSGWRGIALRQYRRDADRRGKDPGRHLARISERLDRQGISPRHGQ